MDTQKGLHLGDLTMIAGYTDPWRARALRAEAKLEAAELVVLYVTDLINMWPSVTFRTIGRVTEKIATLKDAVKEFAK